MDFLLLNLDVLLLLVMGLSALAGAVTMLIARQPMRVAMALIFTMLCLGLIYALLGVHFIAAFQVLIYVGAVMVFMVYAIMLLDPRELKPKVYARRWGLGLVLAALLLAALVGSVWFGLPPNTGEVASAPYDVARFAQTLLSVYWLHFELSSVLLLVVVVAALAVMRIGRDTPQETTQNKRHG
jgi:NADH-quinone oxidoreductase subunit J